jgi:hypothetical protein
MAISRKDGHRSLWQLKREQVLGAILTPKMMLFVLHWLKTRFVIGQWMAINQQQMLGNIVPSIGAITSAFSLTVRSSLEASKL